MARRLAPLALAFAVLALPASAPASFPGSNGTIVYTARPDSPGVPRQLALVDPLSLSANPFTTDPAYNTYHASWSPNGSRIVFTRQDIATGHYHIWVIDANGANARQVTSGSGEVDPAWAPDGHHIVYVANDSASLAILNVDDPTDVPHPIPGTGASDANPAWSPDGALIAFVRFSSTPEALAVIHPDGTGFLAINSAPTSPVTLSDENPAWSPDSSRVYFSQGQFPVGCFANPPFQIYWVAPTGGQATLVSRDPSISEYGVAPSPDGTRIATTRCDDQVDHLDHIYVENIDGTGARPVTSGTASYDSEPNWQPTAPKFGSAPSISGSAVNNQTLTASAGSSPGGGTSTLQFERCNPQGSGCVAIPGASASRARAAAAVLRYRLSSADLGHSLRVRQTQTNALGSASTESAPTKAVIPSKARCSNLFAGTARADTIRGTRAGDRINGGRGRDRLFGLAGADCISGGPGNDAISGGPGNDVISGGPGNDVISVGSGRNRVSAGPGNDRINARNHRGDIIDCGKGRDRVIADSIDKLRHCEVVTRRR